MVFDGSVGELCYTSHSWDADDVWESNDDSVVGTTTPLNQLPPPPVLSSGRRQPDVFTGSLPWRHSYDSQSQAVLGTASHRHQESPAVMSRASVLFDGRPNNNATHGTTTSNHDGLGLHPKLTSSVDINKQKKQDRCNEDLSSSCSSSWNSSPTLLTGPTRSFRARTSTWSGATSTYEQNNARAANLRIIPPAENDYDHEPLAYSCPSRVSSEMKRYRKAVNQQQGALSSSPAQTVSGWLHLPQLPSRRNTASSTTEASHQPCSSSSSASSSCTCTASKRKEGVRFSIDKCSVSLPSIEPDKRVSKDYSSSPTKSDAEKRRVSIGEQVAEYATRLNREGKFSGQTVCPKWVAQHAFEYALTNPTNFRV